jgi:hypothetical protein
MPAMKVAPGKTSTPSVSAKASPAKAPAKALKTVPKKAVVPKMVLSLPTGLSVPKDNLTDYTWLIYGERKIGKTSLLAQFVRNFFLMAEPGGRGLALLQKEVKSWEEFLGYIQLLEDNEDYCDMVTLDTGDAHYLNGLSHIIESLGLQDIRDKAWGGGWIALRDAFRKAHERIYHLGLGFAVTAHSEVKTIKPKFGPEYDKLVVQMSGQAFKYYAGIVDNICYFHYKDDGKRWLQIRGDETVEAGTRCEGRFLYTDGTPIIHIPMGKSPQEGYQNLKLAFANQLPKPVKEVQKAAPISAKKLIK